MSPKVAGAGARPRGKASHASPVKPKAGGKTSGAASLAGGPCAGSASMLGASPPNKKGSAAASRAPTKINRESEFADAPAEPARKRPKLRCTNVPVGTVLSCKACKAKSEDRVFKLHIHIIIFSNACNIF